jgi:hypothetical protein
LFYRGKFLELGEKEKEAAKGTKGFFVGGKMFPSQSHCEESNSELLTFRC